MEEKISTNEMTDSNKTIEDDRSKRKKWRNTKDPEHKNKKVSSIKLPQCHICGLVCSTTSNLKKHVLVHTGDKPYECKYCSKRFRQIQHANDHQRTHTGERPFKCLTCGQGFSQKSSVNVHMKRHIGNKEFICEICKKDFYDKNQLKIHLRQHTGEQPFECEVCKKSFQTFSGLKYHKMKHTGERPYSCEKCGSRFREKSALNLHMGTHLPRGPYICSECGHEFKRLQSLSLHKRVHEANTNYAYIGPKQTMNKDMNYKSNNFIRSGELNENEDDPLEMPEIGYSTNQVRRTFNSDNLPIPMGSASSREYSNIEYKNQPGNAPMYTSNDHNVKYTMNTETISIPNSIKTDLHNQNILPNSVSPSKQSLPPNIPTPQVVQEAMANGTLLETKGEDGQPYLIVLPKSMSEKDISFISTRKSELVPLSTSKVLQTQLYENYDNVHNESKENNLRNFYDINNIHDVSNEHNIKNVAFVNQVHNLNNIEHVNDMDNINNAIYDETDVTSEMLANESITVEFPFIEENNELEECYITISDTNLGMIEIAGSEMVTDEEMNYRRSVDDESIENSYDLTQNEYFVTNKKKVKKEKKIRIPKSYECEQCGKNCKTSSNYITHMRSHTGERPYICAFCNTGFKQPSHLRSHILRHTGERPYLCHLCSCAFTQSSRLKAHIKSIHESGKFNLRQKNRIVRKKKIRNFYCKFCKKTFINECFKSDHMELHKPLRFMCNTCNISFKTHNGFKNHVIIYNNGPNCHLCQIQFCSESQRQSHIADHLQPMEIPKFENLDISKQGEGSILNNVSEENIANNQANIMIQEVVEHRNIEDIENHNVKLSNTEISEQNFRNENSKELILKNSPITNNGQINVKIGGKDMCFVLNSNIHNQNNKCDIYINDEDKNNLETKAGISNTTSQKKSLEKLFFMENAKKMVKKSTRQSKLHNYRYLDETTGITVYKCNYCNKTFNQSANLAVHLRIHTGDRPFVCNVCSADFIQIQHLKSHMLKHTGKRPYVCPICSKPFTQKSAMKRHQILHETKSKTNQIIDMEKEYSESDQTDSHKVICKICNKEVLTSHIKAHLQLHPDIKRELSSIPIEIYKNKSPLKTNVESSIKNEMYLSKFECKNCREIFHELNIFKSHLKSHNGGQEVIICEKCGIIFKRKSALKSHMLIHHSTDEVDDDKGEGLETFKLTLEGEESMNIEVYDTNETIIEETFDTYKTICNNDAGRDKSYICNLCGKVYRRQHWLMRHITNAHESHQERYTKESESLKTTGCDNIHNEGKCKQDVDSNKINDSFIVNDSAYVCQFCGKSFTRAAKLKDHVDKWCKNNRIEIDDHILKKVKTENTNELYSRNTAKEQDYMEVGNTDKTITNFRLFCSVCEFVFETKTSFSLHCDINHKCKENAIEDNLLSESPKQLENHKGYNWNCNECNLSFKEFESFTKHSKSHKRNEDQTISSSEKPILNKESGNRVCVSKPQVKLKSRKQNIRLLYRCIYCSKAFHEKHVLDEHEYQVHLNNKAVEKTSDDAGEDIKYKKLRREEKVSHDQASIESKMEVSQLLVYKNLNEKKVKLKNYKTKNSNNDGKRILYECTVCSMKLLNKEELINHSTVHTGNLPYRCDKCPFAFSQKSHLISHYRKHKGTMNDKNLKDINIYENEVVNSEAKDLLDESERKKNESTYYHKKMVIKRHGNEILK